MTMSLEFGVGKRIDCGEGCEAVFNRIDFESQSLFNTFLYLCALIISIWMVLGVVLLLRDMKQKIQKLDKDLMIILETDMEMSSLVSLQDSSFSERM